VFYILVINWRGHYVIVHQQLKLVKVPLISGAVINQIPFIGCPHRLCQQLRYTLWTFSSSFFSWFWGNGSEMRQTQRSPRAAVLTRAKPHRASVVPSKVCGIGLVTGNAASVISDPAMAGLTNLCGCWRVPTLAPSRPLRPPGGREAGAAGGGGEGSPTALSVASLMATRSACGKQPISKP